MFADAGQDDKEEDRDMDYSQTSDEERPNVQYNRGDPSLQEETIFHSALDCRNALATFSIKTQSEFVMDKSDSSRLTVHYAYKRLTPAHGYWNYIDLGTRDARLDAIENKIATVELIEGLDRKIHNQITQYGSKVGNFLKNLREKELIVNDSSRIGKLEDVITNLGSAFAAAQNTPNLTLKKTVKPVFVPKASGESYNKDEDLKMINNHTTYG
ncbi:Far1 [Hordeum vulgare]|nr:Far1 [Hordeum vulgare]